MNACGPFSSGRRQKDRVNDARRKATRWATRAISDGTGSRAAGEGVEVRTVYAFFEDYGQAKKVVDALIARDFNENEMNVIAGEGIPVRSAEVPMEEERDGDPGTVRRARGLDRLLARVLRLVVADVGQIRAAGTMAKVLSSTAGSNARAYAGLKEALISVRVPAEMADFYRSRIVAGGLLFWIRTKDGRAREATDLMVRRMEEAD